MADAMPGSSILYASWLPEPIPKPDSPPYPWEHSSTRLRRAFLHEIACNYSDMEVMPETVYDMATLGMRNLSEMRRVGPVTVSEVAAVMNKYGLLEMWARR